MTTEYLARWKKLWG